VRGVASRPRLRQPGRPPGRGEPGYRVDLLQGPRSSRDRRRDKKVVLLGLRWPIERTNSWLSNFGQLRRNTDRSIRHRLAQISLAVALLLTAKLIDWRDRWSPA
jgi:hypothetical protein